MDSMDEDDALTYEQLLLSVREQREPEVIPLTKEACMHLIDLAYDRWCDDDVGVNALVQWMAQKFDVDVNDDNFQFSDLEATYKTHCLAMIEIYNYSCSCDLIERNSQPNSGGIAKEKINKAYTVCRETYKALRANAVAIHTLDEMREQQVQTLPDYIGSSSFIDHDKAKKTSFQNLLEHVLDLLKTAKYRRHEDMCYKEVYTKFGYRTHAWKPYKYDKENGAEESTIIDFIGENVTKETDYDNWRHLTNPHDNGRKVVDSLMMWPQQEFPLLKINRYLFAFNNGLYNMKEDMFYPFQLIEQTNYCTGLFWHRVDELDVDEVKSNRPPISNESLIASLHDKVSKGQPLEFTVDEWSTFELTLEFEDYIEIGDHVYQADNSLVIDGEGTWQQMATDITEFRIGSGWTNYCAHAPTHDDVAVRYFDQPFRFSINPVEEAVFDPRDISLPEIEVLLDTQLLDPDTQIWTLIFLARLFYPVKLFDQWEVLLFVKGVAGSGKSTLAKLIRYCFPPELITTLASNIEAKFGLSGIYKGLICICSEVREDFGLDQGAWQSATSGEEVQIAVKNKTPFQHKWSTPMFFLGNVYPEYPDASGSVNRRMFMIEFNETVKSSDPHLFNKMCGNVDLFLRKANALYHEAVRLYGHRDIWDARNSMLPKQIWDFHNTQMINTDTLRGFLVSGTFKYDINHFMPLSTFKTMYTEFCRSNHLNAQPWRKDMFKRPFEEYGLLVERGKRTYGGEEITADFVVGLTVDE